jgi:hypothetical protein
MLSEKTEQTDRSFGSGIAAGAVAKDPAFDPVRLSVNLVCSGNLSDMEAVAAESLLFNSIK